MWFSFRLNQIYAESNSAILKYVTGFKSGQKRSENNHLATNGKVDTQSNITGVEQS